MLHDSTEMQSGNSIRQMTWFQQTAREKNKDWGGGVETQIKRN